MSRPQGDLAETNLAHASRSRPKSIAIYTEQKHTLKSDERNIAGWNAELDRRVHVFDETLDRYLDVFAPCEKACPVCPELMNEFDSVPHRKGREGSMYEPLVRPYAHADIILQSST